MARSRAAKVIRTVQEAGLFRGELAEVKAAVAAMEEVTLDLDGATAEEAEEAIAVKAAFDARGSEIVPFAQVQRTVREQLRRIARERRAAARAGRARA